MKYSKQLITIIFTTTIFLAGVAMRSDARIKAPEFPKGMTWLNSDPLTLQSLRGKVVLLDFWTYCCTNCMHIIPDLKKLEAKYRNELIVIGVHSAKFDNEKLAANIREAILRYGIEHPVINDNDFDIWNLYGAHAWPTLVLIDPEGYVIGAKSGEGVYEFFDTVIASTIKEFEAKGLVNRTPIALKLEKDHTPPSILSFPGKVVADEKSGRLFFTDSDHNRVIIASLDGQIQDVIGQGNTGPKDGNFETAQFSHPQGLFYDTTRNAIYVADTENHAIREIDLAARTVETLAGTGQQASFMSAGGIGKTAELNSPWDLTLIGDRLYIAMAGSHQLWTLDLKTLEARVFAGSGREGIVDGTLKSAALAQPSGISTDGHKIYFADSEASAIREADLNENGKVETLIGSGLFDFGDADGKLSKARLQHPIGVAYHDGFIYVADTYNHKIRRIDPRTREISTLVGQGRSGLNDGPGAKALLNEPNGLAFANGIMYITDTNNHLIRVFDLKTDTVTTLELHNIGRLVRTGNGNSLGDELKLPAAQIAPGANKIRLTIMIPAGTKFIDDAPFMIEARSDEPDVVKISDGRVKMQAKMIDIPIIVHTGTANVTIDMNLYYCSGDNRGQCFFKEARLSIPVNVSNTGSPILSAQYQIPN